MKKRILILNWRSLKDPWAGGAELVTFEHAKRWVSQFGAEVIWMSPPYDFGTKEDVIEGVRFNYVGIPLGRKTFKLLLAFPLFYLSVIYHYLTRYKGNVDVVIDQVHGIPFMTPLYVKEKVVVYIHEVGGKIWRKMYTFPVSVIGEFLEKIMLALPYKNSVFVTVSQSTCNDLLTLGISKERIRIIYNGVTAPITEDLPKKDPNLSILFLNRVVKMKGIERALDIFKLVLSDVPNAQLYVVGRVEHGYLSFLKQKCVSLGISKNVDFMGFVTDETKYQLLSRAHVLINTSYKEGWGLVNLEANSFGTPVVAFNVQGNTESVKPGINGELVEDKNLELMARVIQSVAKNEDLRKSSQQYAKKFEWNIVSSDFYQILES